MSNSPEQPQCSDLDKNIAHEVALVSDSARSLAVASRLTEQILSGLPDDINNIDSNVLDALKELSTLAAIYQDAFKYAGKVNSVYDASVEDPFSIENMLPTLKHLKDVGGLPTEKNYDTIKVDSQAADDMAELQETAAIALINNPPSPDYVRDNDLHTLLSAIPLQDKVAKVTGLLETADFYQGQSIAYERRYESLRKRYEATDGWTNSKLRIALGHLEDTLSYATIHMSNEKWLGEFTKEATAILNNESSTLGTIVETWERAVGGVMRYYEDQATKAREQFEAIISGKAADYTTRQH